MMSVLFPMRRGGVENEVGLVLDDIQSHADQSLDRADIIELLVIAERKGDPAGAGPGRAPDAVNVCLGHVGDIEVDDVRDVVDIDPARGDIGGDEHRHPARLETVQGASPSVLALVAVDCPCPDTRLSQGPDQLVSTVFRSGEDQSALHGLTTKQTLQQDRLVSPGDEINRLGNRLDRRCHGTRLHENRLVENGVGQPADLGGHGGREEQCLAARRQTIDDPSDVVDEAHVEHAIRFVEHQDLDRPQVDVSLADQVEQPAGCGHQHVNPRP
jgi:hypothetical protein